MERPLCSFCNSEPGVMATVIRGQAGFHPICLKCLDKAHEAQEIQPNVIQLHGGTIEPKA